MAPLHSGDVIMLKAGKFALVDRKTTKQIVSPIECVVEAAREFQPGLNDNHMTEGTVVDVRELVDGKYDGNKPLLTVAVSGDFDEKYIWGDLVAIRKMKKTYV